MQTCNAHYRRVGHSASIRCMIRSAKLAALAKIRAACFGLQSLTRPGESRVRGIHLRIFSQHDARVYSLPATF